MENILNFLFISLLIILIPGPDFFIVINQTMSGSTKNGVMASLGISTAHVMYSFIAALGLIFILSSSYYVFTTIKILGAMYIAYLGVKTIMNARKSIHIPNERKSQHQTKLFLSFNQGFMSTMLNPKAILFYISILPQFVTKQDGSMKIILLSALFISIVFIWFALCSYIFTYLKKVFNNPKAKALFDYIVGVTLIGLAFKLLNLKT